MGFSSNSLQVESVTPEKAEEFLKANYAHQRRVRLSWVEYLAREMREGRFMPTAEVHIMYRNGEPVMINGQHTCRAIVKYGKPVRVTVRKTVTNEVGQIAMAYAFGHDMGVRRSFTDGMNAYGLTEQTGLPPTVINELSSAVKYIRNSFRVDRYAGDHLKDSPADMVGYVLHLVPTLKVLNAFVMPCEKQLLKNIKRRSCLSVALITFYHQPDRAAEFWSQISKPDGLAWNDPRVTARKYIETTQDGKTGAAKLSRQIARCWGAFWKGDTLSMVNRVDETALMSIAGTPYNGKQSASYFSMEDDAPSWTPTKAAA